MVDRRELETSGARWGAMLALLVAMYVVCGVFGRFPWKADEPYSFGIVWQMLTHGHWLVPHVAGHAFIEKPPLVYWLGALCAMALPWLPAHESSRLAVLLLDAVTLVALWAAGRTLFPEVALWRAIRTGAKSGPAHRFRATTPAIALYGLVVVALVPGTPEFSEHIHKLTADVGQLAGAAVGLLALVRLGSVQRADDHAPWRRVAFTGCLAGTGAGIAFLSKGLLVPGLLAVTGLLCLSLAPYRSKATAIAACGALLAFLPWLLIWPGWLLHSAPDLFNEWLWDQNVGRFVGSVRLGGNTSSLVNKVITIVVASFASCALALHVLSRTLRPPSDSPRHSAWTLSRDAPGHLCVLAYLITGLATLLVSASFRDNYLLPVLPAVVLLGAPSLVLGASAVHVNLKRGIDAAFALAALIVLWLWGSLVVAGDVVPTALARTAARVLPLPFPLSFDLHAVVAALIAVGAWWYVVRRDPYRHAAVSWSAGMAMLWVVTVGLLLPWIDAARSYRGVFTTLAANIARPACVATVNFGESELAMFEYVTSLETVRAHSGSRAYSMSDLAGTRCEWLLVMSRAEWGPLWPDPQRWAHVAQAARPGDTNARFALYHRHAP